MNRPDPTLAAPTPPPERMAMPTQALAGRPAGAVAPAGAPAGAARTLLARLFAFGGTAGLTAAGFWQMLAVFDAERLSALQVVLLGLVTVTFAWIAFAATTAVAGSLFGGGGRRAAALPGGGRTAVLMPLCNEDPAASLAALQAMGEGLVALGAHRGFEIFVLSDTRDPDVWVRETAAVDAVRRALGGEVPVWYRRRQANTGRKAGNIRDFVETWGGRYEHMLVLDADSLMAPETVVEMVARMAAEPRLGILQTAPVLIGATTLFGRLQQFAGALYGPVVARGVAAWQGLDGNYWGHNALIRTRAFAASCGLPELRGRRPFGGHILSHDFVEAALIRRAGWQVRMDADLGGSYEGAPPGLLDLAMRDRRWAQGNLQHLKVVAAPGLRWPSRVHFAIGIGSYLMSPVWLAMMCSGLLLTGQALFMQPEYFPDAFQLFPTWPTFDAGRMLALFAASLALLLLPKLLGLGRALAGGGVARSFGGRLRLVASFVVEVVVSALYAPIMMLMQVGQIWQILRGRDAGWPAQIRDGGVKPWRLVLRRHWHHSAIGIAPAAALALAAPGQLPWIAPVLVGLVLAPAASRLSDSAAAGRILAGLGLLGTPEEREPPAIVRRAGAIRAAIAGEASRLTLADLARDDALRRRHLAGFDPAVPGDRLVWLTSVTARAKVEAVEDPDAALDLMTPDERLMLAGCPQMLARWAERPAPSAPLDLAGE